MFMTGVTFSTTFTTLFFASRLSAGGQVSDIGGVIVILSLVSLVVTGIGALFGGFLSDKLGRRKIFVLASGIVYTVGALILAFGGSNFPILIAGSALTGLALGVFSSVDQALVLTVLPEKDTAAGRYLGINGYSTSIAQAVAPLRCRAAHSDRREWGREELRPAVHRGCGPHDHRRRHRAVEGPQRPIGRHRPPGDETWS